MSLGRAELSCQHPELINPAPVPHQVAGFGCRSPGTIFSKMKFWATLARTWPVVIGRLDAKLFGPRAASRS
jgi:hypothetical protein